MKSIERLQKIISHAGLASRREAERLISEGRVMVDGMVVTRQGVLVDEANADIKVDGIPLPKPEKKVYYILNKPLSTVSTAKDEKQRRTVLDLLPEDVGRLYPVGRLDIDTEGLLLLTNDGELTYRLLHPRYRVYKTYVAEIEGSLSKSEVAALCHGIMLDDGMTAEAKVRVLETGTCSKIELILHEGRKREVRRMLQKLGHEVKKLRRTAFAGLTLRGLKTGEYRELTEEEILKLKKLTKEKA